MVGRKYRALFIDVGARKHWVEEYSLDEVFSPITLGLKLHKERHESWSKPVYHPDNTLVLGAGLFTGSKMYGTHRFIAVFRSPLTKGLHASAMGGAAYQFNVNADAVVIVGRSEVPLILKIYDEGDGEPRVEYYEIPEGKLVEVWKGYKGGRGVIGLQNYLSDMFKEFYELYNGRSILVGPASKYTSLGALVSITLSKGKIDIGSEDYAARGGGGSVLYRAHGVAAIVYGGKFDRGSKLPAELRDLGKLNDIFNEITKQPYTQAVINAGVKYRFDPKLNTGGTLGGNYPHLKISTPMFNWNMIYLDKGIRERLHGYIMKYVWEPFNREAIDTKLWKTCGEPCPLACKKVRLGVYKSDYEPYNGLGPFIGIFDIHEAQRVVELSDAYGFDAIELGHVIGFVFEAVFRGLLRPDEAGLGAVPQFDPASFKIGDSKLNADLAVSIVEQLAFGANSLLRLIGERGLREAARILDVLHAERVSSRRMKFSDLLVYASFGEGGHITPNYYWTPGLVAPLPVLGKYWTVYSGMFAEPEEFAAKSIERAIYEALVEDMAMCRFHRGWAEKAIPVILEKFYGIERPFEKYKKVYAQIYEYQKLAGAMPTFWDSERIIDFMATAAREYGNEKWAASFSIDKLKAAYEWWRRFHSKVEEFAKESLK